jgi:hypothetical protein
MIKMIKGNHGVVENGKVVAKDKYSDPFEIGQDKEAELIASGFAKKVDAPKAVAKKDDTKKPAETKPADAKPASKTEPKPNDKSNDVKKDVK